jgi:hypothetical protein
MRLGPLPLLTACFLIFAATTHSVVAWAREPAAPTQKSEYDRLVDEALAEFDAGHFEEALSAFEQAYKVHPSARALRGVAKALFELRSYARCVATIDRALASDVDPLSGTLRSDLESLKARALHFVGEAVIEIVPESATVLLDGEAVEVHGSVSRVVDVGPHTLEVSASDHHPQRRKFEIHGGEVTRITVRLDPVVTLVNPPAPPPLSGDARTAPLVLSIGAVAASTIAIVGSSIWVVDRASAVDSCNEAAGVGARCANADSIAFQRNAATWTLVVSGAALVASTVALVLVVRGEKKTPARAATAANAVWTW